MINLARKKFDNLQDAIKSITNASFSVRQSLVSAVRAEHMDQYDKYMPKNIARARVDKGAVTFQEMKNGLQENCNWKGANCYVWSSTEDSMTYETTGGMTYRFEIVNNDVIVYVAHPNKYFAEDSSLREALEKEGFDVPDSPETMKQEAEPLMVNESDPVW